MMEDTMEDDLHNSSRPRLPDGLFLYVILAFLAVAGPLYVDIMPVFVAALRDGIGFTPQQAGLVASLNSYGATVGALAAIFTVTRLPWRITALACLLVLIAADLGSTTFATLPMLCILRSVHGLAAGMLVGISYALMARCAAPERAFGILFVVHFAFGGLGVMAGTALLATLSYKMVFLLLAGFGVITIALLPLLPNLPAVSAPRPQPSARAQPGLPSWMLALALLTLFLFQASNIGVNAFLIGIGQELGHLPVFMGGLIGLGLWLGVAGPLLVMLSRRRFGRYGVVLATLLLSACAKAMLLAGASATVMALAVAAIFLTVACGLATLFALCAAFDGTGRSSTMAGFASKLGLSAGPFIGGLLLQESYQMLVTVAVLAMLAAAALSCWPSRAIDLAEAGYSRRRSREAGAV
jgi:predicted MFS family arabinose efflux permease